MSTFPYHVKTICSYQGKALKRNNFIPKTREMAFARLYISKFSRGSMPPDPPTTSSYATSRADGAPTLLLLPNKKIS